MALGRLIGEHMRNAYGIRPIEPAHGRPLGDTLTEAFARHQGELLGTLYYLTGSHEDAQDAMQEAFVKCWRRRDNVGEINNLKAWVFQIVLNTGRDIRKTAWRRRRRPLDERQLSIPSRGDGPQTQARRREELEKARRAIHALPPAQQEVFLLRQNGAMKYNEIATMLGVPEGTVKTRMRAALKGLREAVEPDPEVDS